MKIYFCDKCNASIPLKDIESNRIAIDAGKIYCQNCAPKQTRSASNFNYPTLAVAVLLGIGVGMVAMALWGDELLSGGDGPSIETQVAQLEKSLTTFRSDVNGKMRTIERDLEESPGVDGSTGKLAAAMQGIRDNGDAIQAVRHGFNGLADELRSDIDRRINDLANQFRDATETVDELNELVKDRVSKDIESIRDRVGLLSEEMAALDARMNRLESAPRPVTGRGGTGSDTVKPAEPALTPDQEKRLQDALDRLGSSTPGERFAAVVDLLEFKVRRSEEALVKALDDDTEYVKTAALNNLGEMNARWTIPHVIEKLKDSNPFVREYAIETLEKLMGRSVGVDPNAPTSKLLAKARELTTWWEENKERILSGK